MLTSATNPVPFISKGLGDTPRDGGCIMQIIDWIHGGGWSDRPYCVHPKIRDTAVSVNDSLSDEGRQKLLAMAPRMMHTRLLHGTGMDKEVYKLNLDAIAAMNVAVKAAIEGYTGPAASFVGNEDAYWLGMMESTLSAYESVVVDRKAPEPIDYTEVCAAMRG